MVRRAERLFDTDPDSTVRLIDSVLRMPAYFEEGKRMDIAMLQAEALFGDRDDREISPLMDDEFFDDKPFLTTSPELERAASYYARKKKYDKAAHAALYSGFVQQHYGEKTAAMQSFKDAERYGEMVNDSLTVAQAEYWMGKMLYDDGLKQEALALFKKSNSSFGSCHYYFAKVLNSMACCYLLCGQYDSTEICLMQSLEYANKNHSDHLRHKVLNNYAVLYRIQGKFDQSIDYLKQTIENSFEETELFVPYLNLGKTFMAAGNIDSAAMYFQRIESLLPNLNTTNETKASAYRALSDFAEIQKDYPLAQKYHNYIEDLLSVIMFQRQEQNIYRIQRQYDYENLQNLLNRKIIRRHCIILVISILLIIASVIILILQLRHKQLLKAEENMKQQIDAMKQDLRQTVKSSVLEEEITLRLKMILTAYRTSKKAKDPQNEWKPLVNQVMNGKENMFEAVQSTVETVYPNLYHTIREKYPNLTETETKICLLSFCDLSCSDTAELLDLKLNTVNQNRSTLRKKLNLGSDKMKGQLLNAFSEET